MKLLIFLSLCVYVKAGALAPSDPCMPNPCANGGVCSSEENGDAICTCNDVRFNGDYCQNQLSRVEVLQNGYAEADIKQHVTDWFDYQYLGNEVSSNDEKHAIIFDREMYMKHHLAAVSDNVYMFSDSQLLLKTSLPLFALHLVTEDSDAPLALKTKSKATVMHERLITGEVIQSDSSTYKLHYSVIQSNGGDSNPHYARIYFLIRNGDIEPEISQVGMASDPAYVTFSASIVNQREGDVLGFTLLSSSTQVIPDSEIRAALTSLLNKHVALSSLDVEDTYSDSLVVDKFAAEINDNSKQLSTVINDWYDYQLDETNIALTSDLSGDILSTGNYITVSGKDGLPHYGQSYSLDNSEFTSLFDDAFMGLLWVSNEMEKEMNFSISVQSFLPQAGSGKKDISSGRLRMSHSEIAFTSVQAYAGANNEKSVCETYFLMQSQRKWGSSGIGEDSFTVSSLIEGTFALANQAKLTGSAKKVLMGYIILSKNDGLKFNKASIQKALRAKLHPLTKKNFGPSVNIK